jgi:hypothetical protein
MHLMSSRGCRHRKPDTPRLYYTRHYTSDIGVGAISSSESAPVPATAAAAEAGVCAAAAAIDEELSDVTQIIGSGRVALQTGTHELRRPTVREPTPPVPACDDRRRREDDATDPERVSGDPLRCRHAVDLFGDDADCMRGSASSFAGDSPAEGSAIA